MEHDPHEPFEVCAVARPLIDDFGNVVPTAVLEQRINDETHDPHSPCAYTCLGCTNNSPRSA